MQTNGLKLQRSDLPPVFMMSAESAMNREYFRYPVRGDYGCPDHRRAMLETFGVALISLLINDPKVQRQYHPVHASQLADTLIPAIGATPCVSVHESQFGDKFKVDSDLGESDCKVGPYTQCRMVRISSAGLFRRQNRSVIAVVYHNVGNTAPPLLEKFYYSPDARQLMISWLDVYEGKLSGAAKASPSLAYNRDQPVRRIA